jgi:hypothetical protein
MARDKWRKGLVKRKLARPGNGTSQRELGFRIVELLHHLLNTTCPVEGLMTTLSVR